MSDSAKKNPVRVVLLFYLICFAFRAVEYLVLRTDQSIIGEAFVHKLIGIGLLAGALSLLKYKWSGIGFGARNSVKQTLLGLLFGLAVYAVAYGTEMIILSPENPSFKFYVSSYSVTGDSVIQDGAIFVFICVLGNIINVIMEEGVFRGLFIRVLGNKYSFIKACLFSALLFGLWHIAQPVRNVLDGQQSPMGAFMMSLMLVGTSALGGIQYTLLYKMTGKQWFSMAAHFVNNAIVNLLHVVTAAGADEMQTVRITVAQSISFITVLIVFLIKGRKSKA